MKKKLLYDSKENGLLLPKLVRWKYRDAIYSQDHVKRPYLYFMMTSSSGNIFRVTGPFVRDLKS